jgi:hypothetical protein
MSVIERAKKHWSDRLTEVREIEVPEWGDGTDPLVIFVSPTNMAQRNKIFKLAQAGDLESLAETLVLRARDKDGAPIFKPSDRDTFMTACDPDVIVRVAKDINSDIGTEDDEALEAAIKN